jgi:4-hydroxybenzoate polyprenyltransferase
MNKIKALLKLIRVNQWHKNFFVLLGFFVLGNYGDYALLAKAMLIFIAFCFSSSSVYIFNDYRDIEADRKHPLKMDRPLVTGIINVGEALVLAVLLCLAGLIISYYVSVYAFIIVVLYMANNLAYSLGLKRYPIIDVFQIGLGFMLRIFAGTIGIRIMISEWMIMTGFMISLLIGFAKRYAELTCADTSHNHRAVLQEYSLETLKAFMTIMASATIITYSLYTLSARSIELHGTTNLIYTTPFVIYGIFRFLYLVIYYKSGDDPSSQIFRDRHLVVTVIAWALAYGLIIS